MSDAAFWFCAAFGIAFIVGTFVAIGLPRSRGTVQHADAPKKSGIADALRLIHDEYKLSREKVVSPMVIEFASVFDRRRFVARLASSYGEERDILSSIKRNESQSCLMFDGIEFRVTTRGAMHNQPLAFLRYRRRPTFTEMIQWHPSFDMSDVSVSAPDKADGSPKLGDMIARNPQNRSDKWLIAKKYFDENFEPTPVVMDLP